ncbi:MAG: hypothetical protein GYA55_02225 [SAR324 cluster bacterium]|uniref:Twin-arginine translocase subunit TatB n=1 Tax=SAR324 cluster bacterium TaxID=2024889 RepID=A0A7X9IKH1_9DELT|nr:hypothetical protein [SAR324 cluster bacterium]
MFGISITELIVILGIALIIFGPEQLPDLLQNLGRLLGKMQKELDGIRRELHNTINKPTNEFRQNLDSSLKEFSSSIAMEEKQLDEKEHRAESQKQ